MKLKASFLCHPPLLLGPAVHNKDSAAPSSPPGFFPRSKVSGISTKGRARNSNIGTQVIAGVPLGIFSSERRRGAWYHCQGCGRLNLRWPPMSHALLLGRGGTFLSSAEYGKKWGDITPLISLLHMANAIPLIVFHYKRLCLWRLERDVFSLAWRKQAVGTGRST